MPHWKFFTLKLIPYNGYKKRLDYKKVGSEEYITTLLKTQINRFLKNE